MWYFEQYILKLKHSIYYFLLKGKTNVVSKSSCFPKLYLHNLAYVVIARPLSHVRLFVTPWTAALQGSRSFTISLSLLKLTSIELVMPSNHLILGHCLFVLSSVFSSESVLCIRWPECWSFSLSICPSSEYSGLISFRIDWFDLLAVQRTLKSSPAPQFERINSLTLSLFCGSNLTSVHDFWKKHSLDCKNLCWKNYVSVF